MCGCGSRSPAQSRMSIAAVADNGGAFELGCAISPPAVTINRRGVDRMFLSGFSGKDERQIVDGNLSSCSGSSIGNNSDDDEAEEEVQSKCKCGGDGDNGGSFDAIQALEEALPFRRGISVFYNGKSKSFTSLADVAPLSSIKDIVKPENAYTRKRKNLLASNLLWEDKNKCDSVEERISKRPCTNASRTSTFAFTVAMNNSARSTIDEDSNPKNQLKQSQLNGSSSFIRNLSTLRSFSMADLQRCQ